MGFWGSLGNFVKGNAFNLVGDIAGGIIGSKAAKTAAKKQLEAANTAIGTYNDYGQKSRDALARTNELQRGDASGVLDRSRDIAGGVLDRSRGYANDALKGQLDALDPYASQGPAALDALRNNAYDEYQGPAFKAPTLTDDPGYQFRLQEGQKALERSAAARGVTGGGAFAKALQRYGQDYASNEYGKAYGRAADEYDRSYGQFMDRSRQRWDRLSQLTGMGYDAAARGAGYRGNFADRMGGYESDYGNRMGGYERDYGDRLFDSENNYGQGVAGINLWQAGNVAPVQLGAGDVNAAGTLGAYSAWGKALGNVLGRANNYFGGGGQSAPNFGAQPIGGTFQQQLQNRYYRRAG